MTYDELAAALFNAQQWATLCAFLLIGVGFYLLVAPIGSCSRCAHCRAERLKGSVCPQHNRPRSTCEDEHRP